MRHLYRIAAAVCLLSCGWLAQAADNCPAWLDRDMRLLRSEHSKNLCAAYGGKPLLVVNTASFCGFTPQFKGLEALYQRYRERGLAVVGFPSDDFFQESDEEAKTADVCYVNYGVTFDMFAPISVRGRKADPLYQELARQGGGAPRWNFYKYLIDANGVVVGRFSSKVEPDSEELRQAIEQVLPPAKAAAQAH